jgi:hypothetical protein
VFELSQGRKAPRIHVVADRQLVRASTGGNVNEDADSTQPKAVQIREVTFVLDHVLYWRRWPGGHLTVRLLHDWTFDYEGQEATEIEAILCAHFNVRGVRGHGPLPNSPYRPRFERATDGRDFGHART